PRPSGTPPKEGNLEDVKVIPSATSFSLLAPLAERLLAMTNRPASNEPGQTMRFLPSVEMTVCTPKGR
ncbi:MAG: hypothetical protein LBT50_08680, partial [Prevotellaceae bacterium]|nr:hypothetical protein [Prevotellaceae bacterium]